LSSATLSSTVGPSSPSRSNDTEEGAGNGLNFSVGLGGGFKLECASSKEKLLQPSGESVAVTLCNPAGQKIECRCTSAEQIKPAEASLRLATKHYDLLDGLTG
jgi:hypothetical protein